MTADGSRFGSLISNRFLHVGSKINSYLANTMRWLLIQLALRPSLQNRLYDEISTAKRYVQLIPTNLHPKFFSNKGSFDQKDCPLLSSVMLENRRVFPVADSLPHQVAEDVEIDGYRFKKGDFFLGSLASVMRDPSMFTIICTNDFVF